MESQDSETMFSFYELLPLNRMRYEVNDSVLAFNLSDCILRISDLARIGGEILLQRNADLQLCIG